MKGQKYLHPEYGLNPSVRYCMYCGVDQGLFFLGNTIEGRAPANEAVNCFDFCKSNGLVVLVEVDDVENAPVGYRVIMNTNEAQTRFKLNIEAGWHMIPTSKLKVILGDNYGVSGNLKS